MALSKIDVSKMITGVTPLVNGGTGATSIPATNLASGVTGTLPTGNGGTGSTATTFVNMTSNVTGVLPVANGGTNLSSGFSNGAGTGKDDVGSYSMGYMGQTSGESGQPGSAGTMAGTDLRVHAGETDIMSLQKSFSSSYWTFSGTWRNMSASSLVAGSANTDMPNGLWVRVS